MLFKVWAMGVVCSRRSHEIFRVRGQNTLAVSGREGPHACPRVLVFQK